MAKRQKPRKTKIEEPTIEESLRALRLHLNQLRRRARALDQAAIEECLTLAIYLSSPQRITS